MSSANGTHNKKSSVTGRMKRAKYTLVFTYPDNSLGTIRWDAYSPSGIHLVSGESCALLFASEAEEKIEKAIERMDNGNEKKGSAI